MFYLLYTLLGFHVCLLPLTCCGLGWPLFTAWAMGASIRRSGADHPTRRTWQFVCHGGCSLIFTLLYFPLTRPFALQAATEDMPTLAPALQTLVGTPTDYNPMTMLIMGSAWLLGLGMINLTLQDGLRNGGFIRERVDHWRRPATTRGALGSSHFCTMREFSRYRRPDPDGMSLYGAFWGQNNQRLDWNTGTFTLSGEDIARGILTLGGPGSGKTQGVILPAVADRMVAGHSLLVVDPQGELQTHIQRFAKVTGHLLVIHDPTRASGPRFNLSQGIRNVSDARAIADVLVPSVQGDNKFWSDSAAALLAACLLRFEHLGQIYNAMQDVKTLANALAAQQDDAALLANAFVASVNSDGKVAANVVATLATSLTGWASTAVRANTDTSDFDAHLIVEQPTVIVLTCPGRMRAVYAPYLGATLRRLMMDLDTIGEQNGGPLPVPVGVILDEFPTLGKLDSLVEDVNLVRKRRISILIGAQTKGQFHLIYGREGTQSLFTGLATQIIYGGCDAETAEFYAHASGTTTESNPDDGYPRSRQLLTVDEIVTPLHGNCTIFARYVDAGFATQVVFHARLTRFYERVDWQRWLKTYADREPILLERGLAVSTLPTEIQSPAPSETLNNQMARQLASSGITLTSLGAMRQKLTGATDGTQ